MHWSTLSAPQGGIDLLENPFVAAARELMEETGIRSITFIAQVQIVHAPARFGIA